MGESTAEGDARDQGPRGSCSSHTARRPWKPRLSTARWYRSQGQVNLKLSQQRLEQSERLARCGACSQYDVERYQAEVKGTEAQLASARWNLESCMVTAPADGNRSPRTTRPPRRAAPRSSWLAPSLRPGSGSGTFNGRCLRNRQSAGARGPWGGRNINRNGRNNDLSRLKFRPWYESSTRV